MKLSRNQKWGGGLAGAGILGTLIVIGGAVDWSEDHSMPTYEGSAELSEVHACAEEAPPEVEDAWEQCDACVVDDPAIVNTGVGERCAAKLWAG